MDLPIGKVKTGITETKGTKNQRAWNWMFDVNPKTVDPKTFYCDKP